MWTWMVLVTIKILLYFVGLAAGAGIVRREEFAPTVPEPTCEQLRAMWRHISRASRHAQLTNEIPTFPEIDFANKAAFIQATESFSAPKYGRMVMRKSNKSRRPPVERLGVFKTQPLAHEQLGLYGTMVRNPQEKLWYDINKSMNRKMGVPKKIYSKYDPKKDSSVAKVYRAFDIQNYRAGRPLSSLGK